MKKIMLNTFLILLVLLTSVCGSKSKDSYFTQEERTRPFPNVISKEELAYGMVGDMFGNKADFTRKTIDRIVNPSARSDDPAEDAYYENLKTAEIGSVVLVEDLGSPLKDEDPYFYYVNIVDSQGIVQGSALVDAMTTDKNPGSLGEIWQAGEQSWPSRNVNEDEASAYVRTKLQLPENSPVQIKAVFVPINGITHRGAWGWAVKTEKVVTVRANDDSEYSSNIFWVDHHNYDIKLMETQNRSTEPLTRDVRMAILTKDVFTEDTRNVSPSRNGDVLTGTCKSIPVAYFIEKNRK